MSDQRIVWMNKDRTVRIVKVNHPPRNQEDVGYTTLHVEAYKGWVRQEAGEHWKNPVIPEDALRELLAEVGLRSPDND